MKSRIIASPILLLALVCSLVLPLAGCGGGGETEEKAGGGETTAKSSSGSSKKSSSASTGSSKAEAKRKFLEGIPYDVFFDQPLAVAATQGTVANVSAGGTGMGNPTPPAGGTPEPSTPPPAAGGGATNWKDLIAAQAIQDEISSLSNTLKANLQSVGSYNTSYLTVPVEGSTIAALALIADAHSEDISWKENARMMATLANQIAMSADGPGKKKMDGAALPFESIGTIIAGSKPAVPPEVDASASFVDLADFGNLMKRFERTEKWLVSNAGTEEALKENSDRVYREASVLAALSKALAEEGYGYHGDEDFDAYVKSMIEASQKMKDGAQNGSHPLFDEGINIMRKTCTDCHGDYRG